MAAFNDILNQNGISECEIKPIYWNNTKLILNVEESKIKNSGNGIFTYQFIPKESLIGEYFGQVKKADGSCVGDYSFGLNKDYYVDARYYPRAYIAMINDSHGSTFKNNCEFRIEKKSKNGKRLRAKDYKISLWAIRNIQVGEELYADYGLEYWKCSRY